jgi:DNA-binding MarR family transcriptional regulator
MFESRTTWYGRSVPTSTPREAVRAVARLARVLERGMGELSLAHYRVLAAIADGDQRASRLAERLALGRPAISAAVESLANRGLLQRRTVEGDLRGTSLRLTAAGRRVLDEVEAAAAAELRSLTARTAEPDRALRTLAALGPALEEAATERHAARRAGRDAGTAR